MNRYVTMNQNLSQFLEAFASFEQAQTFDHPPRGLYEPVRYIMRLGGKRIRPLLVLLAYYLFKDDFERALPTAYAVELFHNFSLVHDDIMDEAPTRRGQPTVHARFGRNAGILSGDVMLIYVYEYLMRGADKEVLPRLLHTFNEVAIGVCEGQQYDLEFEQREDVSIDEYIRMIELKTSVLIGGALKMGALLAAAPQAEADKLYHFGRNLGIAFQIQDDWLDTFGKPEKTGKQRAGDIVRNKKTWMYLKALEQANPQQRKTLRALYRTLPQDPNPKIEAVLELFHRLGIDQLGRQAQQDFAHTALEHLQQVDAPKNRKQLLADLALWLTGREC